MSLYLEYLQKAHPNADLTVFDLIKILQEMPLDAIVKFDGYCGSVWPSGIDAQEKEVTLS